MCVLNSSLPMVAELGVPRRVPGPVGLHLFRLLDAQSPRDLSQAAGAMEPQPRLSSLVSSACPPLAAFVSTSALGAACCSWQLQESICPGYSSESLPRVHAFLLGEHPSMPQTGILSEGLPASCSWACPHISVTWPHSPQRAMQTQSLALI